MYLAELEIVGFKSFAQKLKVEFGDGITVIVGPNGCGKTNIVDAIRWVLGEQRTSILRTDRMEQVIFNGSNGRKPLGMAEVSMVIENTKNILPIEFSQVQVTRRLFRSGESDYLLNKTPCRLKDITDLFLDTGMGAHAYSVIELSMVDDILSDRADARRRLFDEASGVMKYKVRRHEAINKLKATEADLLRINDIVAEVEKKVRSLKYQVGKARRFENYKGRLKDLEIASAKKDREDILTELVPLRKTLDQLREEQSTIKGQNATQEKTLQQLRAQYQNELKEQSQLQEQIQACTDTIHGVEEHLSVCRERKRSLEERIGRNTEEIKGLQQRIEVAREQKVRSKQDSKQIQTDFDEMKKAYSESQKNLSDSDKAYVQHKIAAAQGERKIAELLPLFAEKSKELDHFKEQLKTLHSKMESLEQERKEIEENVKEHEGRNAEARSRLSEATKILQQNIAARSELEKQLETIQASNTKLEEELRALHSEVASHQARLNVLARSIEEKEGYASGVKYLLAQGDEVEDIRGVIGEILRVPSQYSKALQSALGQAEQYILMGNKAAAIQAIHRLKEKEKGYARFLSLDSIPPKSFVGIDLSVFQENGVIGWASDLISCPPEFERAKEFLLRDIIIVDDLESALKLQQSLRDRFSIENGYTFATLEGDVLRTGIIGGGRGEEAGEGFIERRAEVEELRSLVAERSTSLEQKKKTYTEVQANFDRIIREIQSLHMTIDAHRTDLIELEKNIGVLELEKSSYEQRAQKLDTEHQEITRDMKALEDQIESAQAQLVDIEKEKTKAETGSQQVRVELDQFETEKETKTKEVQDLNLKVVSLQWRSNQLKDDIQRLEEIEKDLEETIKRKNRETSEAQQEILQLDEDITAETSEIETLRKQHEELREKNTVLGAAHKNVEGKIEKIDKDLKALRESQQESSDGAHTVELQISDLEHRARTLKERILEEYDVDVDEAEIPEEFDAENASRSIDHLKERIRMLGPVNLLALQEYEEENKRYEFLSAQRNDLSEAKESLKETITEINRTARKRFTRTYGLIRRNFRKTFVQFFGSGKADLQLAPSADPLEADVEIRACTRGTIPGSIDAFSGGEKTLTAIALLFAIYLVKPSPFCILDEIDAPLDDANIGRFTTALREFAKSTQFIVVTHNKKTMEAADRLYGVTMEEEGVSQLVSVRFDEAA